MFDILIFAMVGFVAGVVLIVATMGPEARAFQKAKLRKRPIITIHRSDRMREFKVVDKQNPGGWRVKLGTGGADYETVPEAIDTTKSNIRIADAFDSVGTTIRDDHVEYANRLKARGIKDFDAAQKKAKRGEKLGEKTFRGKLQDWRALLDFLPTYFNPVFIFALIEHRVSARLPRKEPWSVQKVMAVGMVIFIIIIGMVIMFETGFLEDIMGGGGGGGAPPPPGGNGGIVVD